MIELYLFATLVAVGYVLTYRHMPTSSRHGPGNAEGTRSLDTHMRPISIDMARQDELRRGRNMMNSITNNTSRAYNEFKEKNAYFVQSLTGEEIPVEKFQHNNMQPFYRGAPKANVNDSAASATLENFTGNLPLRTHKQEHAPLFESYKQDPQGVSSTSVFREHTEAGKTTNNVLPFKQERVGPGIGQSADAGPAGGFQQLEVNEIMRPRTIDDLRCGSNPKETYEARKVESVQKASIVAKLGDVRRNRPENKVERSHEELFKTTGAVTKPRADPKPEARATTRQDTKAYVGAMYGGVDGHTKHRPKEVRSVNKSVKASSPTEAFVDMTRKGRGSAHDYGKRNMCVANTNRMTTSKSYMGGITSMIKSIISQFGDDAKYARKQDLADLPNMHMGQLQPQVPKRATVHDPNQVPRKTIKETLLDHAPVIANVAGREAGVVYDPSNVPKRTIKETTTTSAPATNVSGPKRRPVYDPNATAKSTIRETTLQESQKGNVKGRTAGPVHDPSDCPRATIKETTHASGRGNMAKARNASIVHDTNNIPKPTIKETTHAQGVGNLGPYKKASIVYDPNDIPRTTIKETSMSSGVGVGLVTGHFKETKAPRSKDDVVYATGRDTLPHQDTMTNVRVARQVGSAYNPEDAARCTIKETTIENEYDGQVDASERANAGYMIANPIAKGTQKQTTTGSYIGCADSAEKDGAYKVAEFDAKATQKQTTCDIDYYGHHGNGAEVHQMAQDSEVFINTSQELLLNMPSRMGSSVKLASGGNDINILPPRKTQADFGSPERREDNVKVHLSLEAEGLTRVRADVHESKVDTFILDTLHDNPFAIKLSK